MSDEPSTAAKLALAPRRAPAPKMVLAASLADAPSRAFLHVDNTGKVRSPARYKLLRGASNTAAGSIMVGIPIVYGVWLGPIGWGVGAGISVFLATRIRRERQVDQASRLLVHGRLDEAESLLHRVIHTWAIPRTLRATALQNLAFSRTRRGDYEGALEHLGTAIALYGTKRRTLHAHMALCTRVGLLVNVGRLKEARLHLEQLPSSAELGEYLQVLRWTTELYLCLGEGRHDLDDDVLYDRARVALGITSAAGLLALLAWAHHEFGDDDQAWHLLREAFERLDTDLIDSTMPLLSTWMQEYADAADVPPEHRRPGNP